LAAHNNFGLQYWYGFSQHYVSNIIFKHFVGFGKFTISDITSFGKIAIFGLVY
jgi:hypothetical protein